MTTTNEFMLVFRLEPNFDYQPTAEELGQMQQQWGAYFGGLAEQGKFVSTNQLGFEGVQVFADKTTRDGIHIAEKQTLGGNVIIKADSMDEAIEIAKKSPILLMGGNVEVRNILPM
jgi:hypothetical protein